jgi:hypothetical protein
VIRYYGKHKIIREFSIQEYRSMGSFKTEAGERVTKTFIDHKVRETKAVFVSDAIDEGRNYCWSCGRTDTRLSCSHIISVNDCQNDGRADKAWDYDNLQLECLECHAETERGVFGHHANASYKFNYIENYYSESRLK